MKMFNYKSALVALSLVASAVANVFPTSPISSTTCTGGQTCVISWIDDGKTPTLAQFGAAKVSIYTGNAQQQTELQTITTSVDVSTTQAIQFTVNPAIGTNGNMYFIRFESVALKDPTNPSFPELAFSSKFTLTGMTGTFSPEVQAEIDGTTTAPIGGGPTANSPPVTNTNGFITTTSAKPSGTTTGTAVKATSNSATNVNIVSSTAGIVGIVAGLLSFF